MIMMSRLKGWLMYAMKVQVGLVYDDDEDRGTREFDCEWNLFMSVPPSQLN